MLKFIQQALSPRQILVNYMLLQGEPGAHTYYSFTLVARVVMAWFYLQVVTSQLQAMLPAALALLEITPLVPRTLSLVAWMIALALIPIMLVCMNKRSWMLIYGALLTIPVMFFADSLANAAPADVLTAYVQVTLLHFLLLAPFWLFTGHHIENKRAGFLDFLPSGSKSHLTVEASTGRSSRKQGIVLAWFYIISGAIGLIICVSALAKSHINALSAVAWLVIFVQIAAAIFGGVEVLRQRLRGYQVLYWVSLSCIPVFGSSLLTYYTVMGLGILPSVSFGSGYSGTSFDFQFGYSSALAFLPGSGVTTLGINLVAVALTLYSKGLLKDLGIGPWPLENAKN